MEGWDTSRETDKRENFHAKGFMYISMCLLAHPWETDKREKERD